MTREEPSQNDRLVAETLKIMKQHREKFQQISLELRSVKGLEQKSALAPLEIANHMNFLQSMITKPITELILGREKFEAFHFRDSDDLVKGSGQTLNIFIDLILDIEYCFRIYYTFDFMQETKNKVLGILKDLIDYIETSFDVDELILAKLKLLHQNYSDKWVSKE